MVKIDWLSFVYKPDDDEQGTFNSVFDAFLARFPKFNSIMNETVVVGRGRGYYSSSVMWNDGICIFWDDDSSNFALLNGDSLSSWVHGVCVQIPSHGLHYLSELLEVPDDIDYSGEYSNIKPVLEYLLQNNCTISRLDIAFDDESKTFYPRDFHRYWDNHQVQSPCHSYSFCGGKGSTFYVGCRANKLLRIYDKEVESKGEIKAIRYEIELHQRYADDVVKMIIDDNFNFFELLQKYFVRLKVAPTCESLSIKSNLSKLDDLPEWVDFINKKNERLANKHCVFSKIARDVTMKKKAAWLQTICRNIKTFIQFYGFDSFYDMLHSVDLRPIDYKLITDSMRIYGIEQDLYKRRCDKFQILHVISEELNKAFPC